VQGDPRGTCGDNDAVRADPHAHWLRHPTRIRIDAGDRPVEQVRDEDRTCPGRDARRAIPDLIDRERDNDRGSIRVMESSSWFVTQT